MISVKHTAQLFSISIKQHLENLSNSGESLFVDGGLAMFHSRGVFESDWIYISFTYSLESVLCVHVGITVIWYETQEKKQWKLASASLRCIQTITCHNNSCSRDALITKISVYLCPVFTFHLFLPFRPLMIYSVYANLLASFLSKRVVHLLCQKWKNVHNLSRLTLPSSC